MNGYLNQIPIDDPMTVLDLLVYEWNDRTQRRLERYPHSPAGCAEVVIDHFGSGYGRHCGTDRYLVTDAAADQLLVDRYVMGTPEWGYTNKRELISTDRGVEALFERRRELGDFPRATQWFRWGAMIRRTTEPSSDPVNAKSQKEP